MDDSVDAARGRDLHPVLGVAVGKVHQNLAPARLHFRDILVACVDKLNAKVDELEIPQFADIELPTFGKFELPNVIPIGVGVKFAEVAPPKVDVDALPNACLEGVGRALVEL